MNAWIDLLCYVSAFCRRLLVSAHPQQLRLVGRKGSVLQNYTRQRWQTLSTSALCYKLNQPKVREERDHVTDDVRTPQQAAVPLDDVVRDRRAGTRSHDQVIAVTVDDVVEGGQRYISGRGQQTEEEGHQKEGEEEEEEWVQSELTLKKLPSIYLKLSKSRLTGSQT